MPVKAHHAVRTLKCLKELDDWDPAQGADIMKRLWKEFAKAAKTTPFMLRRAYSRIVFDGYYGPVADLDWKEAEGYRMPMAHARRLMRAALEHDPYVSYYSPDHGQVCGGREFCTHPDHDDLDEPGPLFHEEEIVIDPYRLKAEMFHGLIEIYGHLSI